MKVSDVLGLGAEFNPQKYIKVKVMLIPCLKLKQKVGMRAWDMTQQLQAVAALPEDTGSSSHTQRIRIIQYLL